MWNQYKEKQCFGYVYEKGRKTSQISYFKYEIQTNSLDVLISSIKHYLFLNKKSERPLKLRVAGLQYNNGIYSQSYQD